MAGPERALKEAGGAALVGRRGASVFGIALVVQCALLLFVATSSPRYLEDAGSSPSPDARHYVLLGVNTLTHGEYSRQDQPPYAPDMLRTPVYPLLAGGIYVATARMWPLYVLQFVLNGLTACFVFVATRRMFGGRAAVVAGMLYAADVMLAVLALQAMSEILFLFLSTWALVLWLPGLVIGPDDRGASRSRPVVLGLLLGLAMLTRPAGLYLPVVMASVDLGSGWLRGKTPFRRPLVMVGIAYLVVLPWMMRNEIRFGLFRLTNADTINLTYFAAAGVYQVKYGIDREEAQARIVEEYGLPPLVAANNPWVLSEPASDLDARQRHAARDILASSPVAAVRASAIGLAKSLVSHNTGDLAAAAALPLPAVALRGILTGRVPVTGIHPLLLAAFVWEVFLAGTALILAGVGAAFAVRLRQARPQVLGLLAVGAYALATIAVVGIDAYSRHRAPVIPILCIFAGAGGAALVHAVRDASLRRVG
jgi:4-amino-4-deoxy-L-arabinose transferase-like glycosyltransferase